MGLQGVGSRLAGGCDVRVSLSGAGLGYARTCSYMDHGSNFCMSTMSTSFSLPHYMQAHEETSSET
jgi:hypothetical protein